MSTLLTGSVNGKDTTQVGKVAGLLVQHQIIPAEQATPAANTTPTPAPTLTAQQAAVFVRYVLVAASGASTASGSGSNGSSTGNIVVVPWQAFAFNNSTASPAAAGSVLTLNMASTAFNSAPRTSLVNLSSDTSGSWASSTNSFWASQGLTIPATGASATDIPNSMMMIPTSFQGFSIADVKDTSLGAASDVFIDGTTGQIAYVAFNGGSTFGNKLFILPASIFTWTPGTNPVSIGNRGELMLNLPTEVLNAAPFFNSINGLQLDQNTLNQINQYWQTIQGATK